MISELRVVKFKCANVLICIALAVCGIAHERSGVPELSSPATIVPLRNSDVVLPDC